MANDGNFKHQPAPWRAHGGNLVDGRGERVHVWGVSFGHSMRAEEREANGRAMERAADLVEAVMYMLPRTHVMLADQKELAKIKATLRYIADGIEEPADDSISPPASQHPAGGDDGHD